MKKFRVLYAVTYMKVMPLLRNARCVKLLPASS